MKKALDLFCGAGGATKGLQRAGFHVTGVDISPQPRYCGDIFSQADAMEFPLGGYDFIWASPPCQRYTAGAKKWGTQDGHPDLIAPIRSRLLANGVPFVIENVETARPWLVDPVMLCGTQFGLGVFRHRLFECRKPGSLLNLRVTPCEMCKCCDEFACNIHQAHVCDCPCPPIEEWGFYDPYGKITINQLPHPRHDGRIGDGKYMTVTGHSGGSSKRDGWKNGNTEQAKIAMGIDWMTWAEMAESIPPAFSEFIGRRVFESMAAMKEQNG